MTYSRLMISTAPTAVRKTKSISKKMTHNFSLGLDELCHLTLVELQKTLATPKLNPSRTLVTREAILRYGREVRARMVRGDTGWFESEAAAIAQLAQRGPK